MPETVHDTSQIDVEYTANLARLRLSADEIRSFQDQLSRILEYVRKIGELNLDGIEPTAHAVSVQNVFRKDEPRPGIERSAVLANAPSSDKEQFLVPKIIE